jgi:tetratricopeptide (TPR) repeat protein
VLDDLDILSLCLHADGRPRQSEPYAARAVEMAAALYGPQHPRYARALRTFGLVLSILEDPRGLDAMREAVVIYDALGATAGWTGPAAMQARNNLASALRMRGAHGEAIEHRRRVLAEVQALPTLSPRHVRTRLLLSIDLIAAGRLDEAEPVLRRAEQDLSRLPQRNRHLEAGIAVHQAVIAEHERRLPDAQRHYARAAALLDGLAQRGDPTLAFCRASAAWLGSSLDDPRSRETLIAAVEGSDDLDDPCLGGQILSRAGWSLRAHDPIRAARWAREGETLLQKVPQLDCDPIRALVL